MRRRSSTVPGPSIKSVGDVPMPISRKGTGRRELPRDQGEITQPPRKCRKTLDVSDRERQEKEHGGLKHHAKGRARQNESKSSASKLKQKSASSQFACVRNISRSLPWVVGLVSDTHGRFDENLRKVFLGVNEIWHGGDIAGRCGSQSSAEDVLASLSSIAPVTTIVRGNVDTFAGGLKGHSGFRTVVPPEIAGAYPQVAFVSLPGGNEAVMTHIGEFPTASSESRAVLRKMLSTVGDEGADNSKCVDAANLVVFGHSHKPGILVHQDVTFINPGSAGPKRFSLPTSAAILRIDEAGAMSAEIASW